MMNISEVNNIIYGWIDSVLNIPGASTKIPIIISDDDNAIPEYDSPFMVIGYTPTSQDRQGNGSTVLPPSQKTTNGYFSTGDTYGNIANFHGVSDGAFSISVDGEAAVEITGLDFTEALSMTTIAQIFQAEINKKLGSQRITVEFYRGDLNYFCFVSNTLPSVSEGITSSVNITAPSSGTDLIGELYLNGGTSTAGVENTNYERKALTEYYATIEIRQVFGNGEYLEKLINTLWNESVILYFTKNKLSIIDLGPIQGVPFKEGNRTITESIMNGIFYFYGVSTEDVGIIENVGINGVLENIDSSESHEISIGG